MKARTNWTRGRQAEDPQGGSDPSQEGSWARPERTRQALPAQDAPAATASPRKVLGTPASDRARRPAVPTPEDANPPQGGAVPRNRAATASLAFGLLALVFMALIPPLGLLFSLVAIAVGLVARKRVRQGRPSNPGQALIGLACGLIGLIVSGALVISEAVYVAHHPSLLHSLTQCDVHAHTAKARAACVQRLTKAVEGP